MHGSQNFFSQREQFRFETNKFCRPFKFRFLSKLRKLKFRFFIHGVLDIHDLLNFSLIHFDFAGNWTSKEKFSKPVQFWFLINDFVVQREA